MSMGVDLRLYSDMLLDMSSKLYMSLGHFPEQLGVAPKLRLEDLHSGPRQVHTGHCETMIPDIPVGQPIAILRKLTNSTDAWKPYMKQYTSILEKHQITKGGNLLLFQIENEISGQRLSSGAENWPLIAYMQQLQQTSRDSGLVIVSRTREHVEHVC